MPRGLRPLDPSANKVTAFAAELRKLYEEAGSPKFLQMARKTGKSRTALSEAIGGDHLPTWETVVAFVAACNGKPNDWRARWEEAKQPARAQAETSTQGKPEGEQSIPGDNRPVTEVPIDSQLPRSRTYRRVAGYVLVAVAGAAMGGTVVLVASGDDVPDHDPVVNYQTPVQRAAISVQNKVAVGSSELIEDATPAYLSVRPESYCANKKCKVDGTEIGSGALLVAVCQVQGQVMHNYNLDSSESKTNPHRVKSSLWYRAVFPDGRAGFISEVYIVPEDRGGLGLPACT